MENFEKAKENFLSKEKNLSSYATKSSDAIRFKEENEDIRPMLLKVVMLLGLKRKMKILGLHFFMI